MGKTIMMLALIHSTLKNSIPLHAKYEKVDEKESKDGEVYKDGEFSDESSNINCDQRYAEHTSVKQNDIEQSPIIEYFKDEYNEISDEFGCVVGVKRTATVMENGGISENLQSQRCMSASMNTFYSDPVTNNKDPKASTIREHALYIDSHATLVVCPLSMIGQWRDEIFRHSSRGSVSVYVYYGQDREMDAQFVSTHDIVITSYGTLSTELQVSANIAHQNFSNFPFGKYIADKHFFFFSYSPPKKNLCVVKLFEENSHIIILFTFKYYKQLLLT